MAIEKMSLVNLVGNLSELDEALIRCCKSGSFHIENSIHSTQGAKGFTVLTGANPFSNTLSKLVDLSVELSIPLQYEEFSSLDKSAEEITGYVQQLDGQLKELNDKCQAARQEIAQLEMASVHVQHLKDMDISFEQIFSSKYVRFRFGRLPRDSYEKLSYYEKEPFFFFSFDGDRDFLWCVYFVPTDRAPMIDEIFASLMFERIRIPRFAHHGTPQQSLEYIHEQLTARRAELEGLQKQLLSIKRNRSSRSDRCTAS